MYKMFLLEVKAKKLMRYKKVNCEHLKVFIKNGQASGYIIYKAH